MFRPVLVPRHVAVWLSLCLLAGIVLFGGICPASGPPRRRPRPASFFRSPSRSPRDARAACARPTRQLVDRAAAAEQGTQADPGLRVPARRDRAGKQRIRRLLRPGELDLAGAGRCQADGRLRAPAAQRLRRLARGGLHRDRDGVDGVLGPITPEDRAFDAALRDPVRFLAMRKTRDPDLLLGMLDRDADLRLVRTADRRSTTCWPRT